MRSVIDLASPTGIAAIVAQQFEIAATILDHGLMPIIEPEVSIEQPRARRVPTVCCSPSSRRRSMRCPRAAK